jgi:hypothetical protein
VLVQLQADVAGLQLDLDRLGEDLGVEGIGQPEHETQHADEGDPENLVRHPSGHGATPPA